MKRWLQRAGAVVLSLVMVCVMPALSGCGKSGGTGLPVADLRDVTYRMEELSGLTADGGYSKLQMVDGRVYTFCDTWTDNGDVYSVVSFLPDGSDIQEVALPASENSYYQDMMFAGDGRVYTIREFYGDDEGTDTQTADAEQQQIPASGTYAECIGTDGSLLWRTPLTEEDRDSYVQSIAVNADGDLVTGTSNGFSVYRALDGQGRFVFKPASASDYLSINMISMPDGKLYTTWQAEDYSAYYLCEIDLAGKTLGEQLQLPEGFWGYGLRAGSAHQFLYPDGDKLRSWEIGKKEFKPLCDFTASDLMIDGASDVCEIDGSTFLAVYYDADLQRRVISRFVKVDPKEYKERQTLTLACAYIYDDLRRAVIEFNKGNVDYRIQIHDYSKLDQNTGKDYSKILESMNLDISAGRIPDIIVLQYNQPAYSYINKGLFADLKPMMEQDAEMSVDDFLPNLIEAYSTNGKLYQMLTRFNVASCLADARIVQDGPITLGNYKEICQKNHVEISDMFGSMQRNWGMQQLMQTSGEAFVDWNNGKCSFDSPEFVEMLELVNALPNPKEGEEFDYEKYETYYREGKSLLMQQWIGEYSSYNNIKVGQFGRDIAFNGYPGISSGISVIQPSFLISIAERSKYKDAAWSFLRTLLTAEAQYPLDKEGNVNFYSFPVRKDSLKVLEDRAQQPDYYEDGEGNKIEYHSSWWIGGQEIEIPTMSKKDAETVTQFLMSVNQPMRYDEKIFHIVEEEAGAYFEGQKSAKEVASIIQSRVSIYLSEIG